MKTLKGFSQKKFCSKYHYHQNHEEKYSSNSSHQNHHNDHLEDNLKLVSLPDNCQLHCPRFISRNCCVDVAHLDD